MIARYRGLVAVPLFWFTLGAVFCIAIMPQPMSVPGGPTDKAQHIFAFVVLALLCSLAYPRVSLWRVLAGLTIFGAVIELVQLFPALGRDGAGLDLVADIVALGVTLLIVALVRRLLPVSS